MKFLPNIFTIFSILFIGIGQKVVSQDLYSVSVVSFNTRDYDEFAAVLYKNGLVFCSNRPQSLFIIRTDTIGQPLSDLYFVKKNEKQRWETPKLFSNELNSRFYEGPTTFSKDGNVIYFTKGDAESEGIYTATFNGSIWEQINPFQYNEIKTKAAQPFLSDDGQKLFFASNRRGGYGGFDLYMCTLTNGNQWSRPKNLGPEINSSADEKYPFLHANGKLYFSSNRKSGLGGFDIYYSQEINGHWIKPVLLPSPLNSARNDYAYVSDSVDRHGYISSDRNNRNGLLDIFEFTMNFPIIDRNTCKPQKINKYIYDFEETSAINTDTTTFLYEWDFGDGVKLRGKDLKVEHKFQKPGDYLVQLNVIDTLTGQVMLNQASNIFPVRDYEQPYITCPDSAYAKQEISFDGLKSYLPDKQIVNYYWDFDDGTVAVGNEVKHSFDEPGTYTVILAITYTDSGNNKITVSRYKKIRIAKAHSQ
jgi:hypothetical protein